MEIKKIRLWTGTKHETRYNATFGNIEVLSQFEKEAKNKCLELAEESLTGSYVPAFIRYKQFLCIVFREPEGWSYAITDKQEGLAHSFTMARREDTRDSVERAARLHLADCYIGGQEGFRVLNHPDDIEEYRSRLAWQERYRQAVERGMSETEAHRFACGF